MRTIRSSLSVWLSLIILIVGLSAGFFYYNRSVSHARNDFNKYISEQMKSLTNEVSILLWLHDTATLNYLSEQRLRDDGIVAITLIDDQESVVFSKEDQGGQKSVVVTRDILYKGAPVGNIEVMFESSRIENIQREIWGATGFVLVVVVITAILAVQVLLSRFLSAQLYRLKDAILKLAHGDYQYSLNLGGKKEIQSIVDGVNLLSKKLVERDLEIRESTDALKTKNDELSSEITERQNAETALKGNVERLHMILDATSDGVWEYDSRGETYISPNLYRTLGYDSEKLQRTKDGWQSLIHSDDKLRVLDTIRDQMNSTTDNIRLEYRIQSKSRGWMWVVERGKIIERDKNGNPVKLIGTIEDVTEFKKAEEEKERLEVQLQHSQKMESIGTLAGGIAHDFNNILASIIGFTELALDEVEDGTEIEDDLQEVYTAGKRAKDLVKQILTFARQADEDIKPVQVSTIAKETLKLLRATIPSEIEIRQNIETNSMIMGDPAQVQQIFLNLCTNAAQSMEGDVGILNISLVEVNLDKENIGHKTELSSGEYLRLSVTDSGPGISPDVLDFIFEPYFTTKKPGQGTGLGLSVVHGIVRSYNGEVFVDSEQGKGTTFSVYLPLIRRHSEDREYPKDDPEICSGSILFVDDEPQITKMGSQTLERLGYEVMACDNSLEALGLFRTNPENYDLIITDMSMPHMRGDKLAKKLIKIRPDIPIIVCTGYSMKVTDERFSGIDIKAFLIKPITKKELAMTVKEVLYGARHKG